VLQYFLAVAKEGNITRAADALHLTQPTLSRQLKELEEELGVVLFDRGNRKISLTDAGVLFQQRAAELVALLDKTRRELSEQEDLLGGVVSIGCVESKASLLLPGLLSAFHKEYPQVRYDLYSAIGDDIKEKLDRGVLDLGILIEPVEVAKYDYRRLPVRDRWGVVLTCGHPLAEKGEISLDQLARLPLNLPRREIVQEEISSWFAGQGPKLQALHYHSLLTNSLPWPRRAMPIPSA
jgi:DNA-binding transcriptional LysR family regulator